MHYCMAAWDGTVKVGGVIADSVQGTNINRQY